jgi:hypothetical protein
MRRALAGIREQQPEPAVSGELSRVFVAIICPGGIRQHSFSACVLDGRIGYRRRLAAGGYRWLQETAFWVEGAESQVF